MYRVNYLIVDTYHWNIYYGGGIGLRVTIYNNYHEIDSPYKTDEDLFRIFFPIALEGIGGIRYFPSKHIGIYLEAGAAKSILQGGVTCRF